MLVPSALKSITVAALAALPVLGLPQDPLARLKQPQTATDPAVADPFDGIEVATPGKSPVIGVYVTPVEGALAEQLGFEGDSKGVLIANLVDGKPAAKAGLKKFDIIVAIDDHPLGSSDDLRNALKGKHAGDTVSLTVLRKGARNTFSVGVEESAESAVPAGADAANDDQAALLARMRAIDKDLAARATQAHGVAEKQFVDLANERRALEETLREVEADRNAHERAKLDQFVRQGDLATAQQQLEKSYAELAERMHSQAAALSDAQRAQYEAAIKEFHDRMSAFTQQKNDSDLSMRQHLESLQHALEGKVADLENARDQIEDRADRARAMIDKEMAEKVESLRSKLGDTATDELAVDAKKVGAKVEEELLELRRHLGDLSEEKVKVISDRAALLDKLARDRANELRDLADHRSEADRERALDVQGGLQKRLDSIETRLAHIEEMVGKLLAKHKSQN